jgi:hypothetical protein
MKYIPVFHPFGVTSRSKSVSDGFVTKDFTREWNNSVYFRLNKILRGFKDQVRARQSGEKCGLDMQVIKYARYCVGYKKKKMMFAMLGLILAASCLQVVASELLRAGWVEKAVLYPQGIVIHAKLDTGAKTSSLHAPDPEYITRDGEDWVRISVTNKNIETVMVEAPVVRNSKIKRHFGESQTRPVILLDLCIGDVRKTVEVNLVDRAGMNYQLLVGRNFLKGSLLIDSGATYMLSPGCPG